MSGVGFHLVLKAQLDAEIGSVDSGALQAIKQTLSRAGLSFTANGEVQLRRPGPSTPALSQEETKKSHD